MNKKNLTNFSKKINSKFELDFDVKKLNWFNIGGLVKAFTNLGSFLELSNIFL